VAKPSATPKASPTTKPKASPTATNKEATPAASPSATPAEPAATPGPAQAAAGAQTYTVRAGDTLPSIAKQMYGDANKWTSIYDANRATIGEDPNLIQVGTQLAIPAKES
jgi:nucleoid-associated protein YgaU